MYLQKDEDSKRKIILQPNLGLILGEIINQKLKSYEKLLDLSQLGGQKFREC